MMMDKDLGNNPEHVPEDTARTDANGRSITAPQQCGVTSQQQVAVRSNTIETYQKYCHKFVSFLTKGFIVGSVGALVILSYLEYSKEYVIVDPFEVPRRYETSGYTGRALANKLADELHFISRKAESRRTIAFNAKVTEMPLELDVPGVKFSLRPIVNSLRSIAGRRTPHIFGEVTDLGTDRIEIVARVDDKPNIKLSGLKGELNQMLLRAAEHIYKDIRPLTLALYYFNRGDMDACIEAIKDSLNGVYEEDKPVALALWGKIDSGKGYYNQAYQRFREAVNLKPSRWYFWKGRINKALAIVHNLEGVMYLDKLGSFEKAIEHFKESLALDKNYTDAYVNWGSALYLYGRKDEAEAKFKKALTINPKQTLALYNLGFMYYERKKLNAALKKFEEANISDSEDIESLSAFATVTADLEKDQRKGDKIFANAEKSFSGNPLFYIQWGDFLADQKGINYRKVEEKYRRAVIADKILLNKSRSNEAPNTAKAYISWGDFSAKRESYRQAIEMYKRATIINPSDVEGYKKQVDVFDKMKYLTMTDKKDIASATKKYEELQNAKKLALEEIKEVEKKDHR